MPQKKWSKEMVVRHILERYQTGQPLNSGYIGRNEGALYDAARRYWGSWADAIKAAGPLHNPVRIINFKRPVWSKEKVVMMIKERHRDNTPLNAAAIQSDNSSLRNAAVRYFGSWANAVEAAGLDYLSFRSSIRKNRRWSPLMVLEEVSLRDQKGLSLRTVVVEEEDYPLISAARRYFDTWANARVLAGFSPVDPHSSLIWNEKATIEAIQALYNAGIALNVGSIQKTHGHVMDAGRRVFGTWRKAVAAAGLDYSKIRQIKPGGWWTASRIKQMIRELESRKIRLSSREIQASYGGLFTAAIEKFGCWSNAVTAAGVDYRRHYRVWSTKAWLRRMQEDEYRQTLERAQTNARKRRRSK